ncbi:MAG: hypothetical protein GYB39_07640 [Algicola sp.]|nr:hypothetical protein [Algicola sp.]
MKTYGMMLLAMPYFPQVTCLTTTNEMRFFRKIIKNSALGVSATILINSSCKADGG